jgi:hypothetical protein
MAIPCAAGAAGVSAVGPIPMYPLGPMTIERHLGLKASGFTVTVWVIAMEIVKGDAVEMRVARL